MLRPVLITPPSGAPVSVDEVKARLRIDHPDEDLLLSDLIRQEAGRLDGVDGVLGRALLPQTWSQSFSGFSDRMDLSLAPVTMVQSVSYLDRSEVQQPFTGFRLYEDAVSPFLRVDDPPEVFDRDDAVTVVYSCGYAQVPGPIKSAIAMMVGARYEFRENASDRQIYTVPDAAMHMLAPYNRFAV